MKPFFLVLIALVVSVNASAQLSTLTISYKGQNKQIWVDGRSYEPGNTYTSAGNRNNNNNIIVIDNLRPGRHTLEVKRNNTARNTSTSFNLRNKYDLNISISNDGSVQLQETLRKTTAQLPGSNAMNNAQFNRHLQNIRRITGTGPRYNAITSVFIDPANFYTVAQARQIIQQITGETYRLDLAKRSLRGITDIQNAVLLNNLFTTQTSKTEFAAYVRTYNPDEITNGSVYKSPMQDAQFELLLNDIRNKWQPGAKMTAVSNAFNLKDNYFTTSQAIQLIQLLSSESERLQLAKLSYKTITDPASFTRVNALFGDQLSMNELENYIKMNGNSTYVKSPMNDTDFRLLLDNTRRLWLPGAKKTAILEAFANSQNNFTVYQVAQLIQLDNDEDDRMDMARSSLRSITDFDNIVLLYNVFPTQQRREELISYVKNFRNDVVSASPSSATAMAPAEFSVLLNETKALWLPGATKQSVLNAFNRGGTYFTTDQAIQLIALDKDEDDRLEMAKASYKTITDKQNFTRFYALFNNQNYKNDLITFVRDFR